MKTDPPLFHIDEPKLTFGYDQRLADPRDGLTLFGPYTRKQLTGQINIGIIGPSKQREYLKDYLKNLHKPIYGTEKDIARPYFPGLEAIFGVYVNFNVLKELDVSAEEINLYLKYTDKHQRVHNLTNLYTEKLIKYYDQEDFPVTIWFVVIPDSIYRYGRPKSKIPYSVDNLKFSLTKKERKSSQMFLFDKELLFEAYSFEVNFHHQLKAKLLNKRIVTQIIRESTIAYKEIWENIDKITLEQIFDTAKGWNIATTLYYKAGGIPWRLGEVRENVCYLGLVYKKIDSNDLNKNACCAAQMFLDSGDGMVFRGNIGPWYNPETKEFHLSQKDASELLIQSLESFKSKSIDNNYPDEIFIHARTHFDEMEWQGFLEASNGKSNVLGIRIREASQYKLYRDYTYAVPRGTVHRINKREAFLWSKGFIPRLQTQLGLETPNPLSIEIDRGDANIEVVCRDILALTKLNVSVGDG